jgi:alpha-tubulin suppressor-like RCC1 family protein
MIPDDAAQRVAELFEAALRQEAAKRTEFLANACGSDDRLWDEVTSLIVEYERRGKSTEPAPGWVGRPMSEPGSACRAAPAVRIGRYEAGRELGRGGMGIVYEAHDPVLRRKIALKVIRLDGQGTPLERDWLRARLLREARTAASLSHPNIVGIYDSGVAQELAYIAMELVDGPSLGRRIVTGRLNPGEVLSILRQAAAALDYSHAAGIVHRDVKPGNIMLQGGTEVKITDFGIAKITSGKGGTRTTLTVGTPSYMSPEQIRNQPVDGRSDQFSLAVVAFEMLTGVTPFRADSDFDLKKKIVEGDRPGAWHAVPQLPSALDRIFCRALARNSADRFSTCAEFARALEEALRPTQETGGATPAYPRRWWLVSTAALLLVFLALFTGGIVLPKKTTPATAFPARAAAPPVDTRRAVLNVHFERLGLRTEAYLDNRPSNPHSLIIATASRNVASQVHGISEVVAMAGGWGHSLVMKSDGSLWAWGWNHAGQVGDGSLQDRRAALRLSVAIPFLSVSAGADHSIALARDGGLWAWGHNLGNLADGTITNRSTPVKVARLTDVVAISAGFDHSLAITRDRNVWAWGERRSFVNGDTAEMVPSRVLLLHDIDAVSAGEGFSLAVGKDGTVWAWGYNTNGHLGDGTTIDRPTPVRVGGLSGVTSVAAGPHHSVALRNDGTVWAWGPNTYGELGDGTVVDQWKPVQVRGLDGVVAIAAGAQHTLALRRDGTVWGWGQNSYGALGDGTWGDRHTPVRAVGLSGVVAIASGGQHSLARKSDGSLWTWGWNDYGQLGTQSIRELPSAGTTTITVNYVQSTGPAYTMASTGFPWILFDRDRRRIVLQPGLSDTSQWGAALGYDVAVAGEYAVNGSFRRANTYRLAGDGVDVAILLDTGDAHPLWSRHINSDNLAPAPFSVRAQLRARQVVRFVVFSGPNGKDGNSDETALEATIDRQ